MTMVPKRLSDDGTKVIFEGYGQTLHYTLGEVLDIATNGPKESYGISIAPTQQMAQQAVRVLGLQQG